MKSWTTILVLTLGCQMIMADDTVQKGERLLGIGINEGSIGFDKAFPVAQRAGMQFVELPQQWDEIEPKPGKFKNQWLDIANAHYPKVGIGLVISLNPIDTNSLRLPADLKGKPFDHPEVISRYEKAVDYVLGRLPNTKLVAFSIGNEIDGLLGADAAKWAQYERFFQAAAKYVRQKKPGVPVGAKVILPSVIGDLRRQVEAVNQHADAVFVSYYPLNGDFSVKPPTVVHEDNEVFTGGSRNTMEAKLCYTVKQVAKRYQISPDKVLYWINTGQLIAINVATTTGGRPRWRVDPDELCKFELRRQNARPQPRVRRRKPVKDYITEYY